MFDKVANNVCSGSLIRTAIRSCPRNEDEKVEENTEGSHPNDNECDGSVNLPQVSGESEPKQQQRDLQHQGQGFQHSRVDRSVSVRPLLSEHREKGREERGGKTSI